MYRLVDLRMATPVILLSLLLAGVGVGAAWYVHRHQIETTHLLHRKVAGVCAAEELVFAAREARIQLDEYRDAHDEQCLMRVRQSQAEIEESLGTAEAMATTKRGHELLAHVRDGVNHFFAEFEHAGLTPADADPNPSVRRLAKLIHDEIVVPANDYLDRTKTLAAETSQENQVVADRMALVLLLLGSCGAVAGALVGFGITHSITRSMVQLSVPVRDAAGKLSEVVGPIRLSSGWGFAGLQDDLERITRKIGTVVDQLQQSQRDRLRAEQLAAVGQLAAGLAHELRNPLMSMKLLVQSAATTDDEFGGLQGRDLEVMNEEIERLEQLVQALLDYARPPHLERNPSNLRNLLEDVVALLTPRADLQRVEIQCDLPKDPIMIDADVGQLRQVLVNLLLNALDAVPDGGKVSVSVDYTHLASRGSPEAGKTELAIRVADTGRGIPDELEPRIFEPFFSSKETGTGLGLSISKRIVEDHGGTIRAANQPGGGAVFTVRLPASEPASPARQSFAPAPAC